MRKTVIPAFAAALLLTACSGVDGVGSSPLEEALATEAMGDEGLVAMAFVDVAGIQDTVGREPVELPQKPEGGWDDADRWAIGAVQDFLPVGTEGLPLVPTSDVVWYYGGLRMMAVKAPPETIQASLEAAAASGQQGSVQEVDGLLVWETIGRAEWEPDGESSMLETASAQALLPCLGGAHVLTMVGADAGGSLLFEYSFATAARVDEEGQGHAWTCLHVPDGAEAYAAGVEGENVTEVTVDGDVVRVDLVFENSGSPVPAEVLHARRASHRAARASRVGHSNSLSTTSAR